MREVVIKLEYELTYNKAVFIASMINCLFCLLWFLNDCLMTITARSGLKSYFFSSLALISYCPHIHRGEDRDKA